MNVVWHTTHFNRDSIKISNDTPNVSKNAGKVLLKNHRSFAFDVKNEMNVNSNKRTCHICLLLVVGLSPFQGSVTREDFYQGFR